MKLQLAPRLNKSRVLLRKVLEPILVAVNKYIARAIEGHGCGFYLALQELRHVEQCRIVSKEIASA